MKPFEGGARLPARTIVAPLPARTTFVTWALWSAIVLGLAAIAWTLPVASKDGWGPDLMAIAPPLARWDAGWYYQIAHDGYRYDPAAAANNVGFYPLYPLLMRGLGDATGMSLFRAGIVISLAALLAAMLLISTLARDAGSDEFASLAALLFYPTSFFLAAGYTESLFLLATAGALVAARRARWLLAGLAGAAAALTRFNGFLIVVPLAWFAWDQARARGRWPRAAFAGMAATVAGAIAFPVYLAIRWGDPLLYVHSKARGWTQHPKPFWSLAIDVLRETVARVRQPGPGGKLMFVLTAGSTVLFLLLTLALFRRRLFPEGLYCAATLVLLLDSGTLDGMHRYVLALFPCFFVLGSWLKRSRAAALGYAWFGCGMGVFLLTRFVHWIFVG